MITIGVVAFRAINDRPYEMNVKPSFANPVPVRWTDACPRLDGDNTIRFPAGNGNRIPSGVPEKKTLFVARQKAFSFRRNKSLRDLLHFTGCGSIQFHNDPQVIISHPKDISLFALDSWLWPTGHLLRSVEKIIVLWYNQFRKQEFDEGVNYDDYIGKKNS